MKRFLTLFVVLTLGHDICSKNIVNPEQCFKQTQPQQGVNPCGALTVICGSMCAGKSEELIKQVGRFIIAGFDILVFKPSIDTRALLDLNMDPATYIPSRNGSWIKCVPVRSVEEISQNIQQHNSASIIAIDEVHFFASESEKFVALIRSLVESGKKVILAGLELDFRSEPFGPMPALLAYADTVIKLTAICSLCKNDTYCLNQRLVNGQAARYNDPLIVVGSNQYEPRCRKCYTLKKPQPVEDQHNE